ncbi:MAG: hypothetical protein HKN91_16950 [Acidimicrobiia bacterium]|nr:hypothetical protein [Acidimicrobiia bacterium]
MKVAVEQAGTEVALRAARILLAERDLTSLGLIGGEPKTKDERVHQATDLTEYNVVMTDAPDPAELVETSLDAGISCVVWTDGKDLEDEYGKRFAASGATLLTGSNLASGLAPSLAAHETARGGEVMEVSIAWTEPGSPLRRGDAIPFPDPVGARWADERETDGTYKAFAAPVSGDWAGALARVTSAGSEGVVTRVVGVADHAAHLEALALAAGVLAIELYSPGAHRPADAAEIYLAKALDAGLGVASYEMTE